MLTTEAPPIPQLRPYQKSVISELYGKIRGGSKAVLLFAPTGAGKTVLASRIVYDAVTRGRRVLFLVHRDVLVGQTADKFSKFGLHCGFIKGGWEEDRLAPVQIASVQTLPRRSWWKEHHFDAVIWDECHLTSWTDIAFQVRSILPDSVHIGLTATPWRLSKKQGMGDIFTDLVMAPLPSELIQMGFLSPLRYFGFEELDLSSVRTTAGDYNEGDLAIAVNKPELITNLIQQWQKLAAGRRTIAFAVNVAHSQAIVAGFSQSGIPSAHVDGSTPIKERERIYRQLSRGEIQVLSSCAALSEGFDVPEVECIILSRPTKSRALAVQQIGRGMRIAPGKSDCIVIDQAGNIPRHGFIEQITADDITLAKGRQGSGEPPPVKQCPPKAQGCGHYLHTFIMQCPHCGYRFPEPEKLTVSGNMVELSPEIQAKKNFYRLKAKQAYSKAFSPDWALVQYRQRFNSYPMAQWRLGAVFAGDKSPAMQSTYRFYLEAIAEKKGKDEEWVKKYMRWEFGS